MGPRCAIYMVRQEPLSILSLFMMGEKHLKRSYWGWFRRAPFMTEFSYGAGFVTIFLHIFKSFVIVFFWSGSIFHYSYKNSIVTDPLVERNCSIALPFSVYEMLQQKNYLFYKRIFLYKGNLFPSQGFAYFFMWWWQSHNFDCSR